MEQPTSGASYEWGIQRCLYGNAEGGLWQGETQALRAKSPAGVSGAPQRLRRLAGAAGLTSTR
ncbi:hypothetical protein QYE77_10835 [Thermanaerothrix sp. 4228-RoL]|uniref:Uncharacterized protein n=1 Tax=Thermanaerothrix solaris TaxID=3058434 RepID=A0ABU3NPJ7_9CHLR|nr:hypothetical protein [Thermanaerothrix sp. 4228-RoL]MDT8898762.1 hypothetical protein [Thermanaerothrix sp. 4228-RoL]